MTDEHVIWLNPDRPTSLYAGRMRLAPSALHLRGAGPGGSWTADIRYSDIAQVGEATSDHSLGNRSWLRLDLRNGGTLLLGTVSTAAGGIEALSEAVDARL